MHHDVSPDVRLDLAAGPDLDVVDAAEKPDRGQRIEGVDALEGEQRGHGDVDLASVYKIAEGRYVFTFREFKIPVASVFFLNFEDRMSTGKFLGITGDGAIANNPAGATLQRMSQTFYPDVEPV